MSEASAEIMAETRLTRVRVVNHDRLPSHFGVDDICGDAIDGDGSSSLRDPRLPTGGNPPLIIVVGEAKQACLKE